MYNILDRNTYITIRVYIHIAPPYFETYKYGKEEQILFFFAQNNGFKMWNLLILWAHMMCY